jgi:hypothetical protein
LSDAEPLLDPSAHHLAEDLLERAWGVPARIEHVERIWGRDHVLRLRTSDGRTAVAKRQRDQGTEDERRRGFVIEYASLTFLGKMPDGVAPRLLGGDPNGGLLLLEDLPAGGSLADALLVGDRARAGRDLVAYAQALARIHGWSIGRSGAFVELRDRYRPTRAEDCWWHRAIERNRVALCALGTEVGVGGDAVGAEVDEVLAQLQGADYRGFVHGDPCPDNVRLTEEGCRVFDFEAASVGSVALDAAYLVAPFPSCWCFGELPAEPATAAMDAYWEVMGAHGFRRDAKWDVAIASALACFVGARAGNLEQFIGWEWGTTTGAARILAWTTAAIGAAEAAGVYPHLRAVFAGLHEKVRSGAPDAAAPSYPALATPGAVLAKVPDWWRPLL